MFPEFDAVLKQPGQTEEAHYQCLMLSDDDKASADFLLHHFLYTNLKNDHAVCFLSMTQSFLHYNCVAQRRGTTYNAYRESGVLNFIEGLRYAETSGPEFEFMRSISNDLKSLYQMLHGTIMTLKTRVSSGRVLFLIDNVNVFLDVGVDLKRVVEFAHYCATGMGDDVTFIGLAHKNDEDDDAMFLWHYLSNLSDVTVHLTALPSGYCVDIDGELCVKWRAKNSYNRRLLYRVQEKSLSLIPPGTSQP